MRECAERGAVIVTDPERVRDCWCGAAGRGAGHRAAGASEAMQCRQQARTLAPRPPPRPSFSFPVEGNFPLSINTYLYLFRPHPPLTLSPSLSIPPSLPPSLCFSLSLSLSLSRRQKLFLSSFEERDLSSFGERDLSSFGERDLSSFEERERALGARRAAAATAARSSPLVAGSALYALRCTRQAVMAAE